MTHKDPAAVSLGRRGGRVRSEAKTKAARENGKKGGRPPKPRASPSSAAETSDPR